MITLLFVNVVSTSRMQASVSHSSAEAELYAMTQATVESLAIKRFKQGLKSAILSSDVKIAVKTDSSAGKTMASRLGLSRESKHIELKHLGFKMFSAKASSHLKKWERITIHQMCSRSSFRLPF